MSVYVALGLVAALAALVFVLLPVLRPERRASSAEPSADDLAERRQSLYAQILELDFEQRIGKLDPLDARELSDALLREAAALLSGHQLDPDAEQQVEREILALRRALASQREPALDAAQL